MRPRHRATPRLYSCFFSVRSLSYEGQAQVSSEKNKNQRLTPGFPKVDPGFPKNKG